MNHKLVLIGLIRAEKQSICLSIFRHCGVECININTSRKEGKKREREENWTFDFCPAFNDAMKVPPGDHLRTHYHIFHLWNCVYSFGIWFIMGSIPNRQQIVKYLHSKNRRGIISSMLNSTNIIDSMIFYNERMNIQKSLVDNR